MLCVSVSEVNATGEAHLAAGQFEAIPKPHKNGYWRQSTDVLQADAPTPLLYLYIRDLYIRATRYQADTHWGL